MAPAWDTNVDVESVASTEISTKFPPSAQYPLWKLVISAIPWIGIQALWSTEFAVTTPYMKDLGMSDAMSSNIWMFGPIAGFFTAPIVGSFSDRCQSRIGRRRPYIMAGLVLLWVASLVFASSKYILPHPYSKWLAFAMFSYWMW
jgi:solute carrier family 45 protein 1/2/4